MLSSAANRAWWRGYVQVRVHPRPGLRPSVVAPRTEAPARRRGIDVSPATLRPQRSLWVVPHAPLRFCHWIRERSRLSSAGRPAESVQGPVEFRPRNRTDDQWSLVREESRRPKRPTESLSARTDSVSVTLRRDLPRDPPLPQERDPVRRFDRANQAPIPFRRGRRPCGSSVDKLDVVHSQQSKPNGAPVRPVFLVKQLPKRFCHHVPPPAAVLMTVVFTESAGHNAALTRTAPTCWWPLGHSTR